MPDDQTLERLKERIVALEKTLFRWGVIGTAIGVGLFVSLGLTLKELPKLLRGAPAALANQEAERAADQATGHAEVAEAAARRVGLLSLGAVPPGSIVAFEASVCPDGWSEYAALSGRTIVGAGQGEGLRPRRAGETGGQETVKLHLSQVPAHKHRTVEAGDPGNSRWGVHAEAMNGREGDRWRGRASTSFTGVEGLGHPHPNMPPFAVLLFCQRVIG